MKSLRKQEIRVGLFTIGIVVLFSAFVFSIGERSRILQPKYKLVAYFHSVSGLVDGAPVMLAGVDIGSVEGITVLLNPGGKRVKVNLVIDQGFQDRIRKDSVARIETMGLLGDKYIEITIGSYDEPILEGRGAIIKTVEPIELHIVLRRGESALRNLEQASYSLAEILRKIDEGQGLAGAIVNERTEFTKAIGDFVGAAGSLNTILGELKNGQGTLGMLLYDKPARANVKDIIASLNNVLSGINEGTGSLGKLVKDDRLYERLATDIGDIAILLKTLLRDIKDGDGMLPKLLSEEASGPLFSDLASAMQSLDSAAQRLSNTANKLDSGEGTLGLLINNPSIFNDLSDILRGAKKSWFLKRWLKSVRKKGEEEKVEDKK